MRKIVIQCSTTFNGRGTLTPFSNTYRLSYVGWDGIKNGAGFPLCYEGTRLATLRDIAKRLCKEHNAIFVDFRSKGRYEANNGAWHDQDVC